jgi:hypothetical protein
VSGGILLSGQGTSSISVQWSGNNAGSVQVTAQ